MASTPRNVTGLVSLDADPTAPAPTAGDHYWNRTLGCVREYDGTAWFSVLNGSMPLIVRTGDRFTVVTDSVTPCPLQPQIDGVLKIDGVLMSGGG